MLGFGLMHGELGAGEFEQSRGHAHVIGVHVGEDNLADVGPGDAAFRAGQRAGFRRPALFPFRNRSEDSQRGAGPGRRLPIRARRGAVARAKERRDKLRETKPIYTASLA